MTLSDIDRQLLDRCLEGKPRAWEDFVDRFLGLVVHVVQHTAASRAVPITPELRDDLVAEVFLTLVDNHYAALRRFRRQSSLATYLTVIARRVVVRRLLETTRAPAPAELADAADAAPSEESRIADRDQVEWLLERLDAREAEVIRMYHLEGRSYQEISRHAGMPVGSVGPILSRAREKLRNDSSTAT